MRGVLGGITRGLAAVVAAAPACLSVRRLVLLAASLLPARTRPDAGDPPSVTLVVATHNEASSLESLRRSLSSLDYPEEKLWTVLVDDRSSDATGARLAEWAEGHPRTTALPLGEHVGKHQAQREGMAAADGEIVVCCDADVRPAPDCLRRLTSAFADQSVGSAAAYLTPDNAAAGPVAHYAAVEAWVTQLVSYAGKDRLDLNAPTPGGCCAYRPRRSSRSAGWRPSPAGTCESASP
jgi:1,2-diacylglycerol 3-beta-glucosyltransferase